MTTKRMTAAAREEAAWAPPTGEGEHALARPPPLVWCAACRSEDRKPLNEDLCEAGEAGEGTGNLRVTNEWKILCKNEVVPMKTTHASLTSFKLKMLCATLKATKLHAPSPEAHKSLARRKALLRPLSLPCRRKHRQSPRLILLSYILLASKKAANLAS